mmetsp:Transcript_23145/g.68800  ORF Transcript_23145/g.68800 Transcript_23145/m.68800 type:complete len:320 (-) Transcript_23145:680-1639(-)
MTTKYGVFGEHKYLADPGTVLAGTVRTKVDFDATGGGNREKGLNFKATVGRTGKTNDATFDKFKSLSQGDKYIDPIKRDLAQKAASKAGNVTDLPFRVPSAIKRSACPGDYHGTCTGKATPYMPRGGVNSRKKGDYPEQPRGIYTNPPKKGTYGMNKFTLSERRGVHGVTGEYEYGHDPEADHKARKLAELARHKQACVTEAPFVPSNLHAAQRISRIPYMPSPPGPAAGKAAAAGGEEGGDAAAVAPEPFRPANAHVAKRVNPIPYEHDPEAPKIAAARTRRLEESKRIAQTGAWRPNQGGNKSDMVRSVVRMNIPRC